jgi:hypothetical protein
MYCQDRRADILVRSNVRRLPARKSGTARPSEVAADRNVRAPAFSHTFMNTKRSNQRATYIDEAKISATLAAARTCDAKQVREILAKAREMKGLDAADMATLMENHDPELLEEMYATARHVKDEIYGNRLVLFAPLYISNRCHNECLYCAFRARNKELVRRTLNPEEIARETRILIEQGHKRVLLVSGESYPKEGFDYVLNAIRRSIAPAAATEKSAASMPTWRR